MAIALRVVELLLGFVLACWVLFVAPFAWILRDGLGPNAIDSTGGMAVARFLVTFWWGPVALLMVLVILALHVAAGRLEAADAAREAEDDA
jgi:hypothetical protein